MDNKLPYLDMVVIRNDDQSFRTDWFIKPIASGRFLNFFSHHPLKLKLNVALNFIKRVNELSTIKTQAEKNTTIMQHLRMNDYPTNLIHRMINSRETTTRQNNNTTPTENIYRTLPYIEKLSPQIRSYIQRSGHYDTTNISFYYNNTMAKIYRAMKGKTETSQISNVIYCIQCQQCDAKYVGLTTNKLKTRLYGHRSDTNKLNNILNIEDIDEKQYQLDSIKDRTAMITHCIDTGHRFDLQSADILDHSNKPSRLPVLEVCHILSTKNINKRTDTDGLNSSYKGIIHTLGNRLRNTHHNNQTDNTQTNTTNPAIDQVVQLQ